jgi:predicted nucleotidyltransferase
MEHLGERLAAIPGVVAVTLGGSRARGEERAGSDWDFGLYYRGSLDVEAVRRLGFPGEVVEPGTWGRLVNGGAWLTVDGERVDLLYRDLETVEHWLDEAERGRFEIDLVEGFVAGMATYVLAGEVALAKVLAGELPRPAFPEALRRSAPPRWDAGARFSVEVAGSAADRGDAASCAGLLAKAAIAAAQARLAERGEWALNEKGLVPRAGLREAEGLLAAVGSRPLDLGQTVFRMRIALGFEGPAA